MYTNIPGAYKAYSSPELGTETKSEHMSVVLIPAYQPRICRSKPQIKTVQTWTEEDSSALQDCFEDTAWDLFEDPDIEEYTSTVLSYINFCTDNVCTKKQIKIFPNQKPWFTNGVRVLPRARDTAFRSGDREAYSRARAALKRGIKNAKEQYNKRIEDNFRDNNSRTMWQGIRNLTDYKQTPGTPPLTDPTLPDQLNAFFARFENNNAGPAINITT